MKHYRPITILAFSAIVLPGMGVSCNDSKPQPSPGFCTTHPDLCEPTTAAKDYFLFKEGSWWVYEEETTHERDSLYVIEYANDPTSADFDITLYSSREDMRYHYFPLIVQVSPCSNGGVSEKKCIYVKRSKGNFGNYIGEANCFFIQYHKEAFTGNNNIYHPDNRITVKEIYDTFDLGALHFDTRTIKIFEDYTLTEHHSPTNHYFTKGIGLIRKEILDSNQVWNLVDYHIEP